MTNREWLDTLSDEEFAEIVLKVVSEFNEKNFDDELDIFDISVGTQLEFEEWLKEKHKEN